MGGTGQHRGETSLLGNDVLRNPFQCVGKRLHAVQELPQKKRLIQLSLSEKSGHLLLMAKNTVRNAPVFNDGVPVTERSGHGLGAKSIVYYVEKLNGQYQFFMENGDFVVRIIL